MNLSQPWVRVITLALFSCAIVCFVAYRAGAFDKSDKQMRSTPSAAYPDSPGVNQPNTMIYSTKSGKVLVPQNSSPDVQNSGEPKMIMPSSKMMVLPERIAEPDSGKKAVQPTQGHTKKSSKQKTAKKSKVKTPVKKNDPTIMPSSKSGPMFLSE